MEMLAEGLVDLALTTHQPPGFTSLPENITYSLVLRAEYSWRRGIYPLILHEKPFRRDIIAALETARVGGIWPTGFSLSGVKAGGEGQAGRDGAPGRNDEPGSAWLASVGLPALPDAIVIGRNPRTVSEPPQAIFSL
ncbi:hypothetical protein BANRA_00003 [Klebsiella pneumoniae]|nr:hypothetical protein BANRA_00003 [Klebsiella pneumoniae]